MDHQAETNTPKSSPGSGVSSRRFGPLGLGCVTFGREIDQEASFRLMDHAWEKGITYFDTAANYAAGASETIVGAWLKARPVARAAIVVGTKVYPPYTPERIAQSVEASRQRLGVDRLDLLFLHKWDESVLRDNVLVELDRLMRANQVGAVGISNFTAGQMDNVLRRQLILGFAPFQILQNNHNLAVREITEDVLRVTSKHAVGVMAYSTLGAGFLTGKYKTGIDQGSRFELIPGHQRIYFTATASRRLARLEAVSARTGHTQTQLALAWALHQPAVDTVLVGGRTIAHLDQAFSALALNDPALLAELEKE